MGNDIEFKKSLKLVTSNFNVKELDDLLVKTLQQAVLDNKYTKEELIIGFRKIMAISQDDWNKRYGYRGYPAIADWISFFNTKRCQDNITRIKKEEELEKKQRTKALELVSEGQSWEDAWRVAKKQILIKLN